MNAIVSVTADWGIGMGGRLPVRNPDDMRLFVEKTTGHTVVMGRVTLEGLPGARPLANRRNVVLTSDVGYAATHPGIECADSVEAALALVRDVERTDEAWLIGGAKTYRELLGYCHQALVTRHELSAAVDTYFPNLDADPAWTLASEGDMRHTPDGVAYRFLVYENAAIHANTAAKA